MIVYLTSIGGDGYSTPSKISARMSDEPLISEACYLKPLCEVSLVPNEPSERTRSALRDLIKEKPRRPHSALCGLLGAIFLNLEPVAIR